MHAGSVRSQGSSPMNGAVATNFHSQWRATGSRKLVENASKQNSPPRHKGPQKTALTLPVKFCFYSGGRFMDKVAGPHKDRVEPAKAERRLLAQYEIARALASCDTLADATPRIMKAICDALQWDHGALWRVDHKSCVLRCVETWHAPGHKFDEFDEVSRGSSFRPGIGLPGRVWASKQPIWIQDVVHDENFPRAPIAAKEGLHAAFSFPILHGREVLGVTQFFSREIREPDEDLLLMMTSAGSQIGVFMERRRAQEELDCFFTLSLDMLCIANFECYFVRMYPAWERGLGYGNQELRQ